MNAHPDQPNRLIYSIGHSNHPLEHFLSLLHQHAIEVLVDVRSAPYSRYVPHFNPPNLKGHMKEAGFPYLYMGKELGGMPAEDEFYDPEGHVHYDRLARAPRFVESLERVIMGAGRYRVALMCSEEDPTHCHRRLLITRVVGGRGIRVAHIRGDGRLDSEAAVAAAVITPEEAAGQLGLFGADEGRAWRSAHPVTRRPAPPRSSPF